MIISPERSSFFDELIEEKTNGGEIRFFGQTIAPGEEVLLRQFFTRFMTGR